MQPEDEVRIRHMIGAAESVRRFVAGRQRADLDNDEMLRFALTRAIEIIGEAASRVSQPTQALTPDVNLEAAVLPSVEKIVRAVKEVMYVQK